MVCGFKRSLGYVMSWLSTSKTGICSYVVFVLELVVVVVVVVLVVGGGL